MQFILASGNAHKAEEIGGMLPKRLSLILQSEFDVSEVAETGLSFVENALIKARHAAQQTGKPAIADDSGICVDALDGAPGLYSARYAGPGATDSENLEKLLSDMAGQSNRQASFVCTLVCLMNPDDPAPIIAQGSWQGTITEQPSGEAGFGYDPVFFVPDLGMTAAELSAEHKSQLSHRGKALKLLVSRLLERYPT